MTDIPAWIGAVGTVGTLTTGLVLFAGTMSDRRKEYSKLIAVWTDIKTLEKRAFEQKIVTSTGETIEARIDTKDISNLQSPFEVSVKLKNSSLQPIYDCTLHATLNMDQGGPSGVWAMVYNEINLELGIVAPGDEISRILLVGAPRIGVDFGKFLVRAFAFNLQFTDAAGRAWTRNQTGRLIRLRRVKKTSPRGSKSTGHRNGADPDNAPRTQDA